MEGDNEYTVMGRMTFVDLAGSERLKTTQSSGKVSVTSLSAINIYEMCPSHYVSPFLCVSLTCSMDYYERGIQRIH